MTSENQLKLYEISDLHKWREIAAELPYLEFPPNFRVAIIPPFASATARFFVKDKEYENAQVSIYLDYFNYLGYMKAPYWEIYPGLNVDAQRFLVGNEKEMIEAIQTSIQQQIKENKDIDKGKEREKIRARMLQEIESIKFEEGIL